MAVPSIKLVATYQYSHDNSVVKLQSVYQKKFELGAGSCEKNRHLLPFTSKTGQATTGLIFAG